MQEEIRSAEKDFCVLGNPDNCPCPDIKPEDLRLPTLPSFDRVTTEAFSTEESTVTSLSSTKVHVVIVSGEETTLLPGINDTTDRQVCCQTGVYILIALLIALFLFILLCLIIKYRRKSKLQDAYHPGKAEAKNGAKSENPAEVVPLNSKNWVCTPSLSQSQSADPIGQSEMNTVPVKTPSDSDLMVDEESRIQDLQPQLSQVELISP